MQLQTITASELVSEIRKKLSRQRTTALVVMLIGIAMIVFLCVTMELNLALVGSAIIGGFLVLIPVIEILVNNSRIKKVDNGTAKVFQRYGTPEELSYLLRTSGDHVLYQSKNFLLTNTFIMNPNDLESIIPLSDIQLAYVYSNSTNFIPTEQGMKVHDIYNYQMQYQFKIGKRGKETIVGILNLMKQAAPWIICGYSPQNVGYAAGNRIKLGDPKPVRQRPEEHLNETQQPLQ